MSVSSIPSPARVKVVQGIRSLFSSAETVSLEALSSSVAQRDV
jgi:hypothetical protein